MKNIPCEPKETAMEMRLLTKGVERNIFAERVAEARARHGGLYKEICSQGTDNRARLASANLYAMFENQQDSAKQMVAGIAMHNLEVFPQSCSKPDLSHLYPRSVLECSDHWSLSKGAGMRAWQGAAIEVVRLQAFMVLAYLAVGLSDHMGFYAAMGFVRAGDPVEYPYVETFDGVRPWVWPMILEGKPLQNLTLGVAQLRVERLDNHQTVRFLNSNRLRPFTSRPEFPLSDRVAMPVNNTNERA
jgi:hypothetical protein